MRNIETQEGNSPKRLVLKNKKTGRSKKGFTLVELIIVITILAILATIAFLAFQGYSAESRDAKRQTELSQISKGLDIFQIKDGKYPHPDEKYVEIKNDDGNIIIIQGEIGDTIKKDIKISGDVRNDSQVNYTYSTDKNKTKYSLTAYLETDPNAIAFLQGVNLTNQAYAESIIFSKRFPFVRGNYVTVFSGSNNIPIEKTLDTQTGSVSVGDMGEQIYAMFGDDKEPTSYTGSSFKDEVENRAGGNNNGGGDDNSNNTAGMCIGDLVVENAEILNTTGLSENKSWQNEDEGSECYYGCKEGYLGKNCNINGSGEWNQLGGIINSGIRAVSGRGELLVISENEIYVLYERSDDGDLDLFKWDGTKWTLIVGKILGKRANYFKMTLDKNNNFFILHGNYDNIGAKKWDGETITSIGEDILSSLSSGFYVELAKNDSNGDIYFYGNNKLFKYDGDAISLVKEGVQVGLDLGQWNGIKTIIYNNYPVGVYNNKIFKYDGDNWDIIGTGYGDPIVSIGIHNEQLIYTYKKGGGNFAVKILDNGDWKELDFSTNLSGFYGYVYDNNGFLYLSSGSDVGVFDGTKYTDLNFIGVKVIVDMKVKNGYIYVLISPGYPAGGSDYDRLKLYRYDLR